MDCAHSSGGAAVEVDAVTQQLLAVFGGTVIVFLVLWGIYAGASWLRGLSRDVYWLKDSREWHGKDLRNLHDRVHRLETTVFDTKWREQ